MKRTHTNTQINGFIKTCLLLIWTKRRICLPTFLISGIIIYGLAAFNKSAAQSASAAPAQCSGVTVNPSDDLRALAASNPDGTVFCLQPGLYRNVSVQPRPSQQFIGQPGVIFNGARVLNNFVRDNNLWKIGGQTQQGQVHANDQCLPGHPRCGYPEDLFINNRLLLHVAERSDVAPGKWFFDYPADTIYIGDDPSGQTIETSVTRNAFAGPQNGNRASSPDVPGVRIENITIEKYAIPAQMGAIGDQFASSNWIVRNCEARLNHGVGINLWHNSQALGNHAHDNGHNGINGTGDDVVVQDNEIDRNNTAGYNPGWEGGAGKFSYTNRLIYQRNYVHDNYGFGAWTDIENRNALIADNIVENNQGPGIMHEISYQAVIRNNILRNNGRSGDYVYSAEILLSSSRDTEVYNNRVVVGASSGVQDVLPNTRMGIIILQGNRDCNGSACQAVNNNVHNNTITYTTRQTVLERGAGISGSGIFSDGNAALLSGNRFEQNIYVAPDCNQQRWFWVTPGAGTGSGHWNNFGEFQQSGFEINGRCTTYPIVPLADFDGDGKTDISVYRPSESNWFLQQSTNGFAAVQFGISTDKIAAADYDGDGRTDIALYRPESSTWYLLKSREGFASVLFGTAEDKPVPADYDGDGRADIALYRPSSGTWFRLNSSNNSFVAQQFGIAEDIPVAGNYDGDGKADIAVWRPSARTWFVQASSGGFLIKQWGLSDDKPVAGDYDGDGKTDFAVWRPSNGAWYISGSQNGFTIAQFGVLGDVPVPGDYDGDGKTDYAVFRPSSGIWYLQQSQNGFAAKHFGIASDKPVPVPFGQ